MITAIAAERMFSASRGEWRPASALLYREEPCGHYAGLSGWIIRSLDRALDRLDPRPIEREHGASHIEPLIWAKVEPTQLISDGETATVHSEANTTIAIFVVTLL